jgi:Mn-dependent DtxR family transcriptional regulator
VLGDEVARELERRLQYATTDPHGRPIPSFAEMQRGGSAPEQPGESIGYGKR